ncbi:fractalkine [Notechis scutatus]|uniref:Fractalkine n=1 Tax=Notechis scutatus TaxID=8663 RepID=A0A6J1V5H7_9SAUR|nr:fractalkine [Notechis scutatus]
MPDVLRILLALLALAVACKGPIPAVAGEPDTTKVCERECPIYLKNKLPSSVLESYTISICRAKTSIILKTKKNRIFCADPDHDWVKKAVQDIDARTIYATTENLPAVNRHSGEAKMEVGDKAQPTRKVSTTAHKTATSPVRTTADPQPFVERGLAGLEATTSSTSLTPPQPETIADKSTLPPDPIANHEVGSENFEEHKRLGEHFTPTKKGLEDFSRTTQRLVSPPVPFPGTDKTSTQSPTFVSETLVSPSARPSTNSSVSKLLLEFVTKDKTLITIPTKLSTSPELFLSSFNTGHKPPSVEGATTQLPINSSRPSSTQFGSDRTSLNSVQFQGVIDAEGEGGTTQTPLSIGSGPSSRTFSKPSDIPPIPGYHQEMFNGSASISNPNTPPAILDCYPHPQPMVRNYIIPVLSVGGVLCVFLAVGVLVYLKRNICTGRSSKRQVQGLMYYPCDSQAETYPLEMV